METNKKLLGIFHVIYGTGVILIFFLVNAFLGFILPFLPDNFGDTDGQVMELVFSLVRTIFLILIVVIPLPSIIGGIALLNGKKWGLIPVMISGCLSLLSFPLGTALGIFTIWVYVKDQKENPQ